MNSPQASLLGMFPSFEKIGGIEASGRLAWQPFADELGPNHLISYGVDPGGISPSCQFRHYAGSKKQAVMLAIRGKWQARTILVWHLGLLKLLPFLRTPSSKVVLFLHGIEAWRKQSLFTRHQLSKVDLFLTNSDHTWRKFLAFNPTIADAPHQTIHLGIGQPFEGPLQPPHEVPAVLMIGRMLVGERYKGHKEMLAAWHGVLARIPHAQLWIVGPGPLAQELERTVHASGLSHSVRIYGAVSEAQKLELLSRCRCLALPSRGEGFGLVYLEAMRMGRPCLVSKTDAGREVVNPPEAGLAADPDNLVELADATVRLLEPGWAWARWSENARTRYENHFTAAQFQRRLIAAVENVH